MEKILCKQARAIAARWGALIIRKSLFNKEQKIFPHQLKKVKGELKTAIQSFNIGGGFIDYVNRHGSHYTKEQYGKLSHTGIYHCVRPVAVPKKACYGGIGYFDAVLKYYDYSGSTSGTGSWTTLIEGAVDLTSGFRC